MQSHPNIHAWVKNLNYWMSDARTAKVCMIILNFKEFTEIVKHFFKCWGQEKTTAVELFLVDSIKQIQKEMGRKTAEFGLRNYSRLVFVSFCSGISKAAINIKCRRSGLNLGTFQFYLFLGIIFGVWVKVSQKDLCLILFDLLLMPYRAV